MSPIREPATHTAEEATPQELRRASVRLAIMLLLLALIVVPLLRELPLGSTTKTGILAWLLVVVAIYWLYTGLGYQPLLLLSLLLFSTAAMLLTTKVALVLVGVHRLSILRRAASGLIVAGAGLSAVNLGAMLWRSLQRRGAQ